MTMENSSRPVTSHPALMHVGGMDLVGNYRTSHGSGRPHIKICVFSNCRSLSSGTSVKLFLGPPIKLCCPPQRFNHIFSFFFLISRKDAAFC